MKFWSILTLLVFLNFTALPSIAAVFGWKSIGANVVLNEEETHSSSSLLSITEKALPKTLSVFDYLKFSEPGTKDRVFVLTDDSFHLSPLLTIFSPPPEPLA